ncbi:MAG: glutamate synthase [Treponema sp.]|nr:glutamate synthase [Treponema sp.]MCL2237516.1 glutamate synthase [Treponema sp.]
MSILAKDLHFKDLNQRIKAGGEFVHVEDCYGQRFIGSALKGKTVTINGTPGNALGCYLDGAVIEVRGNAQDATGDTMNDGKIIIHGNAGDALGYAMRGGSIFVKGNSGYRSGIHMKEYYSSELKEKKPLIVIGGRAGSFLGEYMAGGIIIVLGIGVEDEQPVGNFTGTGMHGGKIFIRTKKELIALPSQVAVEIASADDLREIEGAVNEFAANFEMNASSILKDQFFVLKPNAKNPYKQLYTAN